MGAPDWVDVWTYIENGDIPFLEPQTTIFYWLFQLDDSNSLHRKRLFNQTSILKWLFRVPGCYVRLPEGMFFGFIPSYISDASPGGWSLLSLAWVGMPRSLSKMDEKIVVGKRRNQKTEHFGLNYLLGGGFKYFLFSPLPGEMIQFD